MCFFFSSRRRHTRYWRDWSSDVCSSDLMGVPRARGRRHDPEHDGHGGTEHGTVGTGAAAGAAVDRKSGGWGKSGDLGGCRFIKKKTRILTPHLSPPVSSLPSSLVTISSP